MPHQPWMPPHEQAVARAAIRAALAANRASQAWLARQLGVSRVRVGLVMRGNENVTPAFLARVAAALGTTPAALLATTAAPADARPPDGRTV